MGGATKQRARKRRHCRKRKGFPKNKCVLEEVSTNATDSNESDVITYYLYFEVNHDDDAGPSTVNNNNNISSTVNEDHKVPADALLSAKRLQESVNDSLCDIYDYSTEESVNDSLCDITIMVLKKVLMMVSVIHT